MPLHSELTNWLNLNGPNDNSASNWRELHRVLHFYLTTQNPMYLRIAFGDIQSFYREAFEPYLISLELFLSMHDIGQEHDFGEEMGDEIDDSLYNPLIPQFANMQALIELVSNFQYMTPEGVAKLFSPTNQE